MRVACPSCEARYRLDPAAIVPPGRTVRCMKCATEWFVAAPGPTLPVMPAIADSTTDGARAEAGPAGPTPGDDASPPDAAPEGSPTPDAAAPADVPADAPTEPPPAASRRTPQKAARKPRGRWRLFGERRRKGAGKARSDAMEGEPLPPVLAEPPTFGPKTLPPETHPSRPSRTLSAGAGRVLAALGVVALLSGLVAARETIVAHAPRLAALYRLAGLPVNLVGLDFANLRVRLVEEAGAPVLVVEGELFNPSRRSRDVPPLALALSDAAGQTLYAWTLRPAEPRLEPGARQPFRSRLAAPPGGGQRLVVRFVDDRDRLAGLAPAASAPARAP